MIHRFFLLQNGRWVFTKKTAWKMLNVNDHGTLSFLQRVVRQRVFANEHYFHWDTGRAKSNVSTTEIETKDNTCGSFFLGGDDIAVDLQLTV